MSRTERWDDTDRERFLEVLEAKYGNIGATCREMGVPGAHVTVIGWRKRHKWFDEGMRRVRTMLIDNIEGNVYEAAVDGPILDSVAFQARKFVLGTSPEARDRGYSARHEVTGAHGGPLEVKNWQELMGKAEAVEKVAAE